MKYDKETKAKLKTRLIHETRLFVLLTIFLSMFFFSFTAYRREIVGDHSITYINFLYDFFESLILAKIILIGKLLNLGERFLDKPLIIPTLYKTVVFCLFIIGFSVMEHFVVGFFTGKNMTEVYDKLITKGINEILGSLPIFFTAFIFFFGFMEIGRIMGEDRLFNLFFKKNENIKY